MLKLDYLLLGVLALKPQTGYGLKKYFDTFGRFQRSNTQMSQIYRTLSRMESDNWVSSRLLDGDNPRKAREYSITESGFTVFMDWLSSPYEPPSRFQDPDFEARIAFAGFLSVDQVISLLDTEITVRENQVRKYRHRDRSLPTDNTECDQELKTMLAEWNHRTSCEEMDHHIRQVKALKSELIDLQRRREQSADHTD